MVRIGCQPPWRKYNVEGLSLCDNRSSLSHYEYEYRQTVSKLDRNTLSSNTKCAFPCSFLEYKVRLSSLSTICVLRHMLQMTEDPTMYPEENLTEISVKFWSPSIQVMREEEAYSFLSLVSDCGGVLGLFVGFNFLMIFNFLDFIFSYCRR